MQPIGLFSRRNIVGLATEINKLDFPLCIVASVIATAYYTSLQGMVENKLSFLTKLDKEIQHNCEIPVGSACGNLHFELF
jgi:hypothetical protein